NLISPDALLRDGLLQSSDVSGIHFPAERVDFGPVIDFKKHLVQKAWRNFQAGAAHWLRAEFDAFERGHAGWLDDFTLYMALKSAHNGKTWQEWPRELVLREPAALEQARRELEDAIGVIKFGQFLFFRQWHGLKAKANSLGIK